MLITVADLNTYIRDQQLTVGGVSGDVKSGNWQVTGILSVGAPGSTTGAAAGDVVLPNNKALLASNAAGTGVVYIAGVNASDVVAFPAKGFAGAPNTTQIPAGTWTMWFNTSDGSTKLWANNGGSLKSVTLV